MTPARHPPSGAVLLLGAAADTAILGVGTGPWNPCMTMQSPEPRPARQMSDAQRRTGEHADRVGREAGVAAAGRLLHTAHHGPDRELAEVRLGVPGAISRAVGRTAFAGNEAHEGRCCEKRGRVGATETMNMRVNVR